MNILVTGVSPCIPIFGTDYPTNDGTCVRDYIHVVDIAEAHILALRQLEGGEANKAYNLGGGQGCSVAEVIRVARQVTGAEIKTKICPRRLGDPPVLVADPTLARRELGWNPQHANLETIIQSAWQWQKAYPQGYEKNSG